MVNWDEQTGCAATHSKKDFNTTFLTHKREDTMIEVAFTYDFLPGIDEKVYARLARRATAMMLAADGFIEFRAHRNLTGSPQVRRTSVWESLTHWAAIAQTSEFQDITAEFRTFVTNLDVQFWGPSPLTPEIIRPKK
jgi:heme-degrading monooxygenase HmoA